jgi:ribosomal protein L29
MFDEESKVVYQTRTYGEITEDLMLIIRDIIEDKMSEVKSTLKDIDYILDNQFGSVSDIRELSREELKEYTSKIEYTLSRACEFLYDRISKCGDCPLRFQCRYSEDMFRKPYREMSREEIENELKHESIRRGKSVEELRRIYRL